MMRAAAALAALALALPTGAARADGAYVSPTQERVRLSLGVSLVTAATSMRLDSSAGSPGTLVSGENDLGLARSKVEPVFQIMVRAGQRHRLIFDYFSLDRSATRVLARTPSAGPIVFRDATLLNGDPLQTDLGLRALGIAYGYSFWHTQKFELAATLGIDEIDISANARVQTQTRHVDQRDDQAGPFPTPGIDATWVASRRFYFEGRAQYLKVAGHQLQGSLGLYELDALYRLRPNVSFAVGYSAVKATLLSRQTASGGLFELSAKGPRLFVRVAF